MTLSKVKVKWNKDIFEVDVDTAAEPILFKS